MSVDGSWELVIDTPMGKQAATLELSTDGGAVTGTQAADGKETAIYEGSVDGDAVSWKVDITSPMSLTVTFTGTVAGDEMTGKAKAGFLPAASFTGKRA